MQRVPTLLLLNPLGKLSDLHLENDTVLDCEPLHDLKGHLIYICKELPFLLSGEVRKGAEEILSATLSDTMTCADHRIAVIQLLLYLRQKDIDPQVYDLLSTVVYISELLYLPADERTTKRILRLYNLTWYHHELCRELFTRLHAGMTKERMFGNYLHALVVHAPPQLEIVPLSSVNAEKQERIFSQARKTAIATTNRHPQNVISSPTLRLQAKSELNGPKSAVLKSESRVAKAGKNILKFSGTKLSKAFITKHQRSWNEHIPRISPYLILGERIWWKSYEEEYQFLDGESHELPPMPHLLHFRSATLEDVYKRQSSCWETILEEKVGLPTPDLYEEVSLAPTQLQNTHTTQPHSSTQITSLPSQPPTTLTEIHKQASHTTAQNKEGYHTDIEATSTAEMELNIGDQEHIETAQPILTQAQTFKTKHAACLAKLLGPTTKVIEFDTLRATVKKLQETKQR